MRARSAMSWDNLTVFQLREFGRYLDWAEHHAMYEFGQAITQEEHSNKVMWSRELKVLSETQAHVRELEHKYKQQAA